MRYAPLVLLVATVAVGGSLAQPIPPAEGTVVGNPTLEVVATGNRLTWGDSQELALSVANAGTLLRGGPEQFESRVVTARNLRVEVATDRLDPPLTDGLVVRRGASLVGELGRGEAVPVTLSVGVTDGLRPGTYSLPLRLSYQYTAAVRYGDGDPVYTDRTRTRLVTVPVVVTDEPRLVVTPAASPPLSPGQEGTVSFALSNTGTRTASDIGLTVSADPPVHFGDDRTRRTSVFVPELAPGDSRTLTVPVATDPTATPSTYLLRVSAAYTTAGGFERTSDKLRLGLRVRANDTAATTRTDGGVSVTPYSVGDRASSGRYSPYRNGATSNSAIVCLVPTLTQPGEPTGRTPSRGAIAFGYSRPAAGTCVGNPDPGAGNVGPPS
ncbi:MULTISPECIES: COG1361 S-layer family protein [Salinibaculum]|uniref:COG1361 S-layer family protein n=1 Tax=Salinibaculum TaxID=2732368 RepID=UPI0030D35D5D